MSRVYSQDLRDCVIDAALKNDLSARAAAARYGIGVATAVVLCSGIPHGRCNKVTFIAGLRSTGVAAPFVFDGPIDRHTHEIYVGKVLVPHLASGDFVAMTTSAATRGRVCAR